MPEGNFTTPNNGLPQSRNVVTDIINEEIDKYADPKSIISFNAESEKVVNISTALGSKFASYFHNRWLGSRPQSYQDDYNNFDGNELQTIASFIVASNNHSQLPSLILATDSAPIKQAKKYHIRYAEVKEDISRRVAPMVTPSNTISDYRTARYDDNDKNVIKRDEFGISAIVCKELLADIVITPNDKLGSIDCPPLVDHLDEGNETTQQQQLDAVVSYVGYWVAKGKREGAYLGNHYAKTIHKAETTTPTENHWIDDFANKSDDYKNAFNLALKLKDITAMKQDATDAEKTLHIMIPLFIGMSAGNRGVTIDKTPTIATKDIDELLGTCVIPSATLDNIRAGIPASPSQDFIDGFADSFHMQLTQGQIYGYTKTGRFSPLIANKAPYIGAFADTYLVEYLDVLTKLANGETPKTDSDLDAQYPLAELPDISNDVDIIIDLDDTDKIPSDYYQGLTGWLQNPTWDGLIDAIGFTDSDATFDSDITTDVGLGTGSRILTQKLINKSFSVVKKFATRWNKAINKHYYIYDTFPNGLADIGLVDGTIPAETVTWTDTSGQCRQPTFEEISNQSSGSYCNYYEGSVDDFNKYYGNDMSSCCIYVPPATHTVVFPAITLNTHKLHINSDRCVSEAGMSKTATSAYIRGYMFVMENNLRFANGATMFSLLTDIFNGKLEDGYTDLVRFKKMRFITPYKCGESSVNVSGLTDIQLSLIASSDYSSNSDEYLKGAMDALEFVYLNAYATIGYSLVRNSNSLNSEFANRLRYAVKNTFRENYDVIREAVAVKGCEIDISRLKHYKPKVIKTVNEGKLYGNKIATFIEPAVNRVRANESLYRGLLDYDYIARMYGDIYILEGGYKIHGKGSINTVFKHTNIVDCDGSTASVDNGYLLFDKNIYMDKLVAENLDDYIDGTKSIESAINYVCGLPSNQATAFELMLPYIRDGYADGCNLYDFNKYSYSDYNLPMNINKQSYSSGGNIVGFPLDMYSDCFDELPIVNGMDSYLQNISTGNFASPNNSWWTPPSNQDIKANNGEKYYDEDFYGFKYNPTNILQETSGNEHKIYQWVKEEAYRLGYASAFYRTNSYGVINHMSFTSLQLGSLEVADAIGNEITKVVAKDKIDKTLTDLNFDVTLKDTLVNHMEEDHTPTENETTTPRRLSSVLQRVPMAYYNRGRLLGCYLGYYGGYLIGSIEGGYAGKDFNSDVEAGVNAVLGNIDKFTAQSLQGELDAKAGQLEIKGVVKSGETISVDLYDSTFDPDEALFDTSLPSGVTATGNTQADVDKGVKYGKWLVYIQAYIKTLKRYKPLDNHNASFKFGFIDNFDKMYNIGYKQGRDYLPKDVFDIFENCSYDLPFNIPDNGILRLMVRVG